MMFQKIKTDFRTKKGEKEIDQEQMNKKGNKKFIKNQNNERRKSLNNYWEKRPFYLRKDKKEQQKFMKK